MRFAAITGPVRRGLRNPWRSRARAAVVVLLLASVTHVTEKGEKIARAIDVK